MTIRYRARTRATTLAIRRALVNLLRRAEVIMPGEDERIEQLQPGAARRREEDQHLRHNLHEAGRLGTQINMPSMAFKVSAEQNARAIVTGPRRYMIRLRRIELGVEGLLTTAGAAWTELAERYADNPGRFARAWQAWVRTADVAALNKLIAIHNEWYPVEANLPIDIRTGGYITRDGRDYRHELITPDWLLARFPTNVTQALAGADVPTEAVSDD